MPTIHRFHAITTYAPDIGDLSRLPPELLYDHVLQYAAPDKGLLGFSRASRATRATTLEFATCAAIAMITRGRASSTLGGPGAPPLSREDFTLLAHYHSLMEACMPHGPILTENDVRRWREEAEVLFPDEPEEKYPDAAESIWRAYTERLTDLHLACIDTLPRNFDALTSLQSLSMEDSVMEGLGCVGQMTNLRALFLSGTTHASLQEFHRLTELEVLDLHNAPLRSLAGIESLKKLKYLNIRGTEVEDLTPLAELPELRVVHIDAQTPVPPIVAATGVELSTKFPLMGVYWMALEDYTTREEQEHVIRRLSDVSDYNSSL